MIAKTPTRPRKTTTRSRTKTAATAVDAAATEKGAEALEAAPAEQADAPKKPVRRRRKAAEPAAVAPETTEQPVTQPAEDAPVAEDAPKPKRTRRRATPAKKATTKAVTESAPEPTVTDDSVSAPAAPVEAAVPEKAPEPEKAVVEPAAEVPAETVAAENPAANAEAEKATEPKTTFADLELSEPILRAVTEMGYTHPTPIQEQAIPAILMAKDVLGVAQTGTGKTASFTLPMLEILSGSRARARMPRSLILEPTRELALQVAENFVNYGKHLKLTHALLIGGESMADQKEVLNRGVDVLIATPGRLLDLFERGGLLLTQTRILVIDEADRMLDMGFIPDIEKIVGLLPANRQTLFFSATMAPVIRQLADAFLHSPKEITVSRASSVATTITAGLVIVDEHNKRDTLRKLLRDPTMQNAIVFCNRKRDVDVLMHSLQKHGFSVGALHGDLPQSVRFATLEKFKNDELKILVCSDVAARGIDIGGLSHVFNFDLPFHAEDYVHRIGRTGRAGKEGHAYSLATPYDKNLAEAIETLTGNKIPRLTIDGIEQLDWSDEKRPPQGRRREKPASRNQNGTRGEKTANAPQQHKAATPKSAPTAAAPQPAQESRRSTGRLPRRDEAPPMPAGDVVGFGNTTPAFMQFPRRTTILADLPAPTADVSVSEEEAAKHST
ncbi:ATP-dependent RNA helicase [Acetobacter malorum]|uniref:DEAD-box ATP-dependent RNA helicase RhpA n=1 Tax=Acetobacter malorum TaxID=178901 RepID=A0A177GEG7_9PROT|nr:DEAD/DEAH box helicase [Acetobacter malorum]OAG77784.1 ATP-dependent RNA helicase [Acetobacter malorum]